MNLEKLLRELSNETYVMIKPSPIEGIGVFAIRDIPKGCRDMFSKPTDHDEWLKVPKTTVAALPQHAQDLIENYCLFDTDHYFIPEYGFKKMDLVNFLNHADNPNIISINDGDYFEAIRDIKKGEELVIDYGEITDASDDDQ